MPVGFREEDQSGRFEQRADLIHRHLDADGGR